MNAEDMTIAELRAHHETERTKLRQLVTPASWVMQSRPDELYRAASSAEYAVDYVDLLLERIERLEERVTALETNHR